MKLDRLLGILMLLLQNERVTALYLAKKFELRAVHINAMDEARKLKPHIPPSGCDGIPMKHEFEFEIIL